MLRALLGFGLVLASAPVSAEAVYVHDPPAPCEAPASVPLGSVADPPESTRAFRCIFSMLKEGDTLSFGSPVKGSKTLAPRRYVLRTAWTRGQNILAPHGVAYLGNGSELKLPSTRNYSTSIDVKIFWIGALPRGTSSWGALREPTIVENFVLEGNKSGQGGWVDRVRHGASCQDNPHVCSLEHPEDSSCRDQASCKEGDLCQAGRCRRACAHDDACDPGSRCQEGVCRRAAYCFRGRCYTETHSSNLYLDSQSLQRRPRVLVRRVVSRNNTLSGFFVGSGVDLTLGSAASGEFVETEGNFHGVTVSGGRNRVDIRGLRSEHRDERRRDVLSVHVETQCDPGNSEIPCSQLCAPRGRPPIEVSIHDSELGEVTWGVLDGTGSSLAVRQSRAEALVVAAACRANFDLQGLRVGRSGEKSILLDRVAGRVTMRDVESRGGLWGAFEAEGADVLAHRLSLGGGFSWCDGGGACKNPTGRSRLVLDRVRALAFRVGRAEEIDMEIHRSVLGDPRRASDRAVTLGKRGAPLWVRDTTLEGWVDLGITGTDEASVVFEDVRFRDFNRGPGRYLVLHRGRLGLGKSPRLLFLDPLVELEEAPGLFLYVEMDPSQRTDAIQIRRTRFLEPPGFPDLRVVIPSF